MAMGAVNCDDRLNVPIEEGEKILSSISYPINKE